ncbi:type I restriction enzyme, S subunit [Marinobacter sp. LV10R510-11A]|uniref:restriction endonuclease subunit S n=1 Tax=Marinobacter sp. LV10R510-11A TaxID=1415568 RepID=UPI000BBF81D8|nr:restriction endonuclease subunit S [Marinobacter sp. LV10R510-11A]SOB78127.1 type I restriction enzyme, S subunit [Marinobacter sp. LV10R510-11A]
MIITDSTNGEATTESWTPESFPIPNHWVYADFEQVFENIPLTGLKIPQKEYQKSGEHAVVDQGADLIGGYTNDSNKVLSISRPVIVFGDHTKCFKYISFPFAPGADGVKVLMPRDVVSEKYAFYASKSLRLPDRGYSRHFSFLRKSKFPLPPLNEQHRIVAKIETLFSELDNGTESLKTAREQLKIYRQTVLKHAFEGKLTAQWREQNKDKLETSQQLLARIQQERQARYQRQLKNWQTTVKVWEENDKEGKKPAKPMTPSGIRYPAELELTDLPGGWCWVEYAGLCEQIRNGISAKPEGDSGTKIFRISAVRAMEFALDDVRYIQNIGGIYDQYLLAQGDLVFTRYNGSRNYVGVCAEYKGDGTHLYPDKLIQTRIGVPSLSSKFLEGAINCGDSRRFIESRIRTTAGQSGISGGDIKSIPIPVCGTEEQEQIAIYLSEQTSEIDKMVEEVEAGVRRAETLRQSILKKAFSGQLVPQDANDEPASALLARIQSENATHAVSANKTTNKKLAKPRNKEVRDD